MFSELRGKLQDGEAKTEAGVRAEPLTGAKSNSSAGIYLALKEKSVSKQHSDGGKGEAFCYLNICV